MRSLAGLQNPNNPQQISYRYLFPCNCANASHIRIQNNRQINRHAGCVRPNAIADLTDSRGLRRRRHQTNGRIRLLFRYELHSMCNESGNHIRKRLWDYHAKKQKTR